MQALAARKSTTEMFKAFTGKPAEVLSAQYEQYSKEEVVDAAAEVFGKKKTKAQEKFDLSEKFFRGGDGQLSSGFSSGKNTYISAPTFKSRDTERVSFNSLDAAYSNVSHVFFFAKQAQKMLNTFYASAVGAITPFASKIKLTQLFEGQKMVIAGMVELFGGEDVYLANPAHVTLAYSRDKIVEFLTKETRIRVSDNTAKGAASRLGSMVRSMLHMNLPEFEVDGLSLNLVANGNVGVSDYTLYYLDMPEAKITLFPLNATSPEAWKVWGDALRTQVSNKSDTLSKIKRTPVQLTQDELLSLVGDFGFMHELDPTMQARFGMKTAKGFFAPEKARVKNSKPDFVGIRPGFVNTALMAAFKDVNDSCVRYDVQFITPSESTVAAYLKMSLNTEPDPNLVKLVCNANRMYLVHPRVIISQEYIRYVAQSLPARDSVGRITEPNFESLRSYFASVVCGGFARGDYVAPKEGYSLQCSQLHEVVRRRTAAGVPEREPATNEHNITVTARASAMYMPPKNASEGMLGAIDSLLHKQARLASSLCVPPETPLHAIERFVKSLPSTPTPTGSGPDIPGAEEGRKIFDQLRAVKISLASMQHIPLFTSQSMGFTVGFEKGRLTTQSLEANKGLSEAAIQVTHNLHRSRDRIDSLFGEASSETGTRAQVSVAQLYCALSLYGDVPKLDELFKRAVVEWKKTSGFDVNELTCIDVFGGWFKNNSFELDTSAGVYTPFFCVDPAKVTHKTLRSIAEAMYRNAAELTAAYDDSVLLGQILQRATVYEKGFMSGDATDIGQTEVTVRFLRNLAACLQSRSGVSYVSMRDDEDNYFAHAFLPNEQVTVNSKYVSKLANTKVRASAVKSSTLIPASVNTSNKDEDVDADEVASDTSTGLVLPTTAYAAGENPFTFFANFRVVSSDDTFVPNLKALSRLSLVGVVANLVNAYVFDAINNPDSAYYKPFFPMGGSINQTYSSETGTWVSSVSDYAPLISVTDLMRTVMPQVYSRVIYSAKPEIIASSLNKQLTSAGLSQDLIVKKDGGGTMSIPLSNLMEKINIPNLAEDTEIMRHQGVTLYNTVGSPKARSGQLPNITVLAVDPGGGKTIMGESLALMITDIMQKQGLKTKFLVCAPNKIVKNWYDDAQRFFGHRLNVYTLDTDVFGMMPADYIRAMVEDAPDNSIFISSYSVLVKSAVIRVSLGANQIQERSTLSFLLSLGFTDVLFDESHMGKNEHSITAKSMASLCQKANVRAYLATGSMSAKSVADAASQLAMVDRGVMQSTATFYRMNVPATEFSIEPTGAVKDDKMSANSVRKLRKEMSRVCNFQYVPGSNWAFSRPKIVYDVAVIKPGYMCHSPEEEYYKAMMWMISNGYLTETWEDIVQRDAYYMNVYNLLLKAALDNTEDAQKILSIGSVETEEKATDTEDGESEGDDEGDDDEAQEVAAEELSPQLLQRFSQYLNDPTHDILDGKLVNLAETNKSDHTSPALNMDSMTKINLSTIRAPKIRMAAYFAVKHFTDDSGKVNVTEDNIRGRKLVFVADNIRTLFAFKRQLPAFLRERTRISISGKPTSQSGFHPNYEKELEGFDFRASQDARFDFESSDNVWILCAVESALSEGFNLQIANMMIRSDSPWASKSWKQTKARIDRPDTGKFFRDVAYITWLVTDHTTEILRWARAVSRITTASVFDNANDPRFDPFKTVPLFSINVDTLLAYSSFESLGNVTVPGKGDEDKHANYIDLFQKLQGVEQSVRADAMKNDWEYARKHNLIETLKDKNGKAVLRDGNPVQRPRLMARSETSVLAGSREVLITPTVRGASNDRLRAYGFKTYSMSRLLSAYNADLSSLKRPDEEFGAHVYTAYGFGRIESFGISRGGGIPTTVSVRYPNGSAKSVPINHVTVIENVTQDNPNLWMLNCMLDIPTYFGRKDGDPAKHRILNFDNSTGDMQVREVSSSKDGHAVLGAVLKPADDFLEEDVTTFGNLNPRFDDGTVRADSGIRASRLLNRDDVVLRQGKMYVVKPALSLSGRARKVDLAVSMCEIDAKGKRKKEVFVPYADFARDFGFRIAWPEDYTSMLRAAAIRNFDTNTTANSLKSVDVLLVDFEGGRPKARYAADGSVATATLSKIDVMRLAAGLPVTGFPEGTTLVVKAVGDTYELRYKFPGYENLVKTGAPVVTETAARLIARCASITFGEYTSYLGDSYNGFIYPDAKEPPLGSAQASKRVGTYAEVVMGKATPAGADEPEPAKQKQAASQGTVTLLEFLMEDGVFAVPVLHGELKPRSGDGSSYTMNSLPLLKLHYANKVNGKNVGVNPNTVVGATHAADDSSGVYYDLSEAFKFMQYVLIPVPDIFADTVAIAKGLAEELADLIPSAAQDPAVHEFMARPAAYLKNFMPDIKAKHISTKAKFEKGTTNDARKLVAMLASSAKKMTVIPVITRNNGERQVYLFIQHPRAQALAVRIARERNIPTHLTMKVLTHPVPTYGNVTKWPAILGRVFGADALKESLEVFTRDLSEVAHGKLKTAEEKKR